MKPCSKRTVVPLILVVLLGVSAFGQVKVPGSQVASSRKVSLLLVGHGGPAKDFPKLKEYFSRHEKDWPEAEQLNEELLRWPRNETNDPYWAGIMRIADEVRSRKEFHSVHVAFNEMCAPLVEEALAQVLGEHPDVIVVTSVMMTPGGGHSERDIPDDVEAFKLEHPEIQIVYAWPYDTGELASFLIHQSTKFLPGAIGQ